MLRGRVRAEAPRRLGGYFRNDADHRDFTAIGTAAGGGLQGAVPSKKQVRNNSSDEHLVVTTTKRRGVMEMYSIIEILQALQVTALCTRDLLCLWALCVCDLVTRA